MTKSNQEIIKEIVRAKGKILDAGVIFDDESLRNIVDAEDFANAQKIMVDILCEAIVVHAEYLEDEERDKQAKEKAEIKKIIKSACICKTCVVQYTSGCPMKH